MKNKYVRPEYYLITKNFLTGNNLFVSPLLNQEGEERKTVGLEFLVAAPADYQNTDPEVISVFLDKQGVERDLAENNYQIQCHKLCSNKIFNSWAERAIKTFNVTNNSGLISLDFNDLVETLEVTKNHRFVFKTIAASEILEGGNALEGIASTSNTLAYIANAADISLEEFQAIAEAISNQADKKTLLNIAFFNSPEAEVTEVSLLYAQKNNF